MLLSKKRITYKGFGLIINSEVPMPELPAINIENYSADVEIKIMDLSRRWSDLSGVEKDFVVCENLVMFQVANVATFSVSDGKNISISPIGEGDINRIRLFILGSCMGALLMQRKVLPLHGSALVINDKAYAFVGDRGAGKSTIAAALLRKGSQILTDDVIAITLEDNNQPYVIPSYPQQKLWQESLLAFDECPNHFKPLYERETKYAVPVIDQYYANPIQLGGIFELRKTENEQVTIKPIQGLERIHTLYIHTFRQFLLNGLGLRQWHFRTTAGFSNQISMYQLQRPTTAFTADELVKLVMDTIDKGEKVDARNKETLIR